MSLTREQHKTSEKELNKMSISNLPNKVFKVRVTKVLTKLRTKMGELRQSENFNKDRKCEKHQSKLSKTITEMKNTLQGIGSRLDDTY